MKVQSKFNNIQESNIGSGQQFSINASAQAFKILTDSLYQHKISTIIRELSCNAYDSHIEAGNIDKPFDITKPNNLEPSFVIRDYGIGLTKDEMISIYTKYFESTKQDTNDLIGGFGLGSKTPLCYVDNFNVISYKDGVMYSYVVLINDVGFPEINLLAEIETDEPNGLRIEIAVENDDIYKWHNDTREFFKHNEMNVNINGDLLVREEKEILYETENFKIVDPDHWTTDIHVKVGQVCYKLDAYSLTGDIDGEMYSFMTNNRIGFELSVDIGSVDVAASRESLSLTDRTIKHLVGEFERVFNEIDNDFKEYEKNFNYKNFNKLFHGKRYRKIKVTTSDNLIYLGENFVHINKSIVRNTLGTRLKGITKFSSGSRGLSRGSETGISSKHYGSNGNKISEILVGFEPFSRIRSTTINKTSFNYVKVTKDSVDESIKILKDLFGDFADVSRLELLDNEQLPTDNIYMFDSDQCCSSVKYNEAEFDGDVIYYVRKNMSYDKFMFYGQVIKNLYDCSLYGLKKGHLIDETKTYINVETDDDIKYIITKNHRRLKVFKNIREINNKFRESDLYINLDTIKEKIPLYNIIDRTNGDLVGYITNVSWSTKGKYVDRYRDYINKRIQDDVEPKEILLDYLENHHYNRKPITDYIMSNHRSLITNYLKNNS